MSEGKVVCFHCSIWRAGGYFRFLVLMPNTPQRILAYMLLYIVHLLLSLLKHILPSTLFLVGTPCKCGNKNWYSEGSHSKFRNKYHLWACQKHMSCFNSPPFYHSKVLVRVESIRKVKQGLFEKKSHEKLPLLPLEVL